jgi:hypothetical protein
MSRFPKKPYLMVVNPKKPYLMMVNPKKPHLMMVPSSYRVSLE